MAQKRDKSMPIMQYRSNNLQASVWRNEVIVDDKIMVRLSSVLEKSYKKKDGTYAKTNQLFPHEVPQAIVLLQRCYEYMILSCDSREGD
jgi:hypothetical protein